MSDARPAKFRETLWFVKGAKDAEAADEAAMSGDHFAPAAADSLPIEDRYLDDGTVRPSMSNAFGLHTGTTAYITPMTDFPAIEAGGTTLNEKAMISDLKRGRFKIVAAIGACAIALVTSVVLFAM